MSLVLVLIGNPARPAVGPEQVMHAEQALERAGARVAATRWLADGIACDIGFAGIEGAEAIVRAALGDQEIDIAVVPAEGRRKRLLVADMESTIIENEMLDELAEFLGLRAHIAAITARAMNGEIDFAGALRERVALLKGLPAIRLDEAAQRIRYVPGGAELVATMRANGATCALVSGGFTVFTALVRAKVGFDLDRANRLLIEGDTLAGTVAEPILGREAKLAALQELAQQQRLALTDTLTVGDGANDLPMLQAAGLGVAFRAKPAVAAATRVHIDHGDLTALLYLQGYRQSEFVGGFGG
jgi:phosphoserine phosphatase